MKTKRPNQLNELMTVNPGIPGGERFLGSGQIFVGVDGSLYRPADCATNPQAVLFREADVDKIASDPYFLGEDGTLYRSIRS